MHLVKRFFGSIVAKPLNNEEQAFVSGILNVGEMDIWNRFSKADQRHSFGVAKKVEAALMVDRRGTNRVLEVPLAAALMHDCGKVESNLGTFSRVLATITWLVLPTSMAVDKAGTGYIGRIASYRLHPEIGGKLLQDAGSDELVWTWAADHHKPESKWRADTATGTILKDCDDD